jgi:prepilin-type N-terminal cleavage/methylation domain-containing protein/prepilin-type processing-associated H-X9-DG protein
MSVARNIHRHDRTGFTLVELLVVIGIIALLISILLPALQRVRESANSIKCQANLRTMGQAAMVMAAERNGFIQTSSDHWVALHVDPNRERFVYRDDGFLADFASALLRYMGTRSNTSFQDDRREQLRAFECPSDIWLQSSVDQRGYKLWNNVTSNPVDTTFFPISYGINADITVLSTTSPTGQPRRSYFLGNSSGSFGGWIGVAYGPPPSVGVNLGQALSAKLSEVQRPSEVILFADWGVRTGSSASSSFINPLDQSDILYITTNFMSENGLPPGEFGTLAGVARTGHLGNKIPWQRHNPKAAADGRNNGRINAAFADGHVESISRGDAVRARVTPYLRR